MSCGGALLGGIIGGAFFGGPGFFIGSLIGGAIGGKTGASVSRTADREDFSDEPSADEIRLQALEALFRSIGKLAKSDGVVSQAEADFVSGFLHSLGMPSAARRRLLAAFNAGKSAASSAALLYQVQASFNADAYPDILRTYCLVAAADQEISGAERAFLKEAEQIFGLPGLSDRFLREFQQQTPPAETSLDEACRTLGITPEATDEEVKKAWRNKVKEYHPDRLRSRNLPENMMKMAEAEMRRINAAYERIKKARNL